VDSAATRAIQARGTVGPTIWLRRTVAKPHERLQA